jgi:prepilin-type N-terminal cleavage/methylation domain-containing protein
MTTRTAFSLIELLIVTAIIAILAGLLVPAITMIRSRMMDLKCCANMRQIGLALTVYVSDYREHFPDTMHTLLEDASYGMSGLERLLQCPRDLSKGTSPDMGREFYNTNDPGSSLTYLWEENSSYVYEVSAKPCNGSVLSECYYEGAPRPADNTVSWFTAKRNQVRYGWHGNPMPECLFPIVRCYHHVKWGPTIADCLKVKRVNNISWGGTVYWTRVNWEYHIDPTLTPWLQN